MLAVAELELLSPGKRFSDIHMDVLRRLQFDQDQGPEQAMHECETDHEPEPGFGVGGAQDEPRRQPPEA